MAATIFFLLSLILAVHGSKCPSTETPSKQIVCYYEGTTPLESVNLCNCTHLIFTNAAQYEGSNLTFRQDLRLNERSALDTKNLSLIFTVTIQKDQTSLLKSEEKKINLLNAISSFLRTSEFKGVEINFEFSADDGSQKDDFASFIKDLRNILDHHRVKREGYSVFEDLKNDYTTGRYSTEKSSKSQPKTTTKKQKKARIPRDDKNVDFYDEDDLAVVDEYLEDEPLLKRTKRRKQQNEPEENTGYLIMLRLSTMPEVLAKKYNLKILAKYADYFMVPTHMITDDSEKHVTFHPSRLMGLSDMLNTDSILDLLTGLGAPKPKIIISMPAFVLQYELKHAEKNTARSPTVGEPKIINQPKMCSLLKNGDWTIERDEDLTAPYAFSKTTWLAYEDEISVNIKAKYILLRELAGGAVYPIDSDLTSGNCGHTSGGRISTALQNNFANLARKPRQVVLESLQEQIHDTSFFSQEAGVHLSEYRIVRVVDHEGAVHVIRKNTKTEFECSRQGYFSHPLGCNKFYRCVKFNQYTDDFTVFEYDCPAGLAFDERWEVCVWPGSLPNGAPCTGSSEIAPVPRSHYECPNIEGYYADPENCRWFFACLDHARDGVTPLTAYEFRCPFGLVFDERTLVCDWPWVVGGCGARGASGVVITRTGGVSSYEGAASFATIPDYIVSGGRIESKQAGVVLNQNIAGLRVEGPAGIAGPNIGSFISSVTPSSFLVEDGGSHHRSNGLQSVHVNPNAGFLVEDGGSSHRSGGLQAVQVNPSSSVLVEDGGSSHRSNGLQAVHQTPQPAVFLGNLHVTTPSSILVEDGGSRHRSNGIQSVNINPPGVLLEHGGASHGSNLVQTVQVSTPVYTGYDEGNVVQAVHVTTPRPIAYQGYQKLALNKPYIESVTAKPFDYESVGRYGERTGGYSYDKPAIPFELPSKNAYLPPIGEKPAIYAEQVTPIATLKPVLKPIIYNQPAVSLKPVFYQKEIVTPRPVVVQQHSYSASLRPVVYQQEVVTPRPIIYHQEVSPVITPKPVVYQQQVVQPVVTAKPVVYQQHYVTPKPIVYQQEVGPVVTPKPVVYQQQYITPKPVVYQQEIVQPKPVVYQQQYVTPKPVVYQQEVLPVVTPKPVVYQQEIVQPVITPKPVVYQQQYVTPKPVVYQQEIVQPVVTPKPVVYQQQYVTPKPVVYQQEIVQPVVTPKPVVYQQEIVQPVVTPKPVVYQQEIVQPKPVVYQQQYVTPKPVVYQQEVVPVVTPKPVVYQQEIVQPVVTPKPVVYQQQYVTPKPVVYQQEIVQPVVTPKPVVYQQQYVTPKPVVYQQEIVQPVVTPKPVVYRQQYVTPKPIVYQQEIITPKPVVYQQEIVQPIVTPKPVVYQQQYVTPRPTVIVPERQITFARRPPTTPKVALYQQVFNIPPEQPVTVTPAITYQQEIVTPRPVIYRQQYVPPKPVVYQEQYVTPKPVVYQQAIETPKPVVYQQQYVTPKPVIYQQKIAAPKPVVYEQQYVTPKPVVYQQEIITPKPVVYQQEYITPKPVVYEQKIITPKPVIYKQQYETPEPVIYQQEIVTPKPVVYQQQYVTPKPVIYQKEVVTPKPVVYQQEVVTPKPVVYQQEYITPKPVVFEQKIITPKPVIYKQQYETPEPVIYQQQYATRKPLRPVIYQQEIVTPKPVVYQQEIVTQQPIVYAQRKPVKKIQQVSYARPIFYESYQTPESEITTPKPLIYQQTYDILPQQDIVKIKPAVYQPQSIIQKTPKPTFIETVTVKQDTLAIQPIVVPQISTLTTPKTVYAESYERINPGVAQYSGEEYLPPQIEQTTTQTLLKTPKYTTVYEIPSPPPEYILNLPTTTQEPTKYTIRPRVRITTTEASREYLPPVEPKRRGKGRGKTTIVSIGQVDKAEVDDENLEGVLDKYSGKYGQLSEEDKEKFVTKVIQGNQRGTIKIGKEPEVSTVGYEITSSRSRSRGGSRKFSSTSTTTTEAYEEETSVSTNEPDTGDISLATLDLKNLKIKKNKKTVIVVSQVSDANPILIGKLAGQCSCQSNKVELKNKEPDDDNAYNPSYDIEPSTRASPRSRSGKSRGRRPNDDSEGGQLDGGRRGGSRNGYPDDGNYGGPRNGNPDDGSYGGPDDGNYVGSRNGYPGDSPKSDGYPDSGKTDEGYARQPDDSTYENRPRSSGSRRGGYKNNGDSDFSDGPKSDSDRRAGSRNRRPKTGYEPNDGSILIGGQPTRGQRIYVENQPELPGEINVEILNIPTSTTTLIPEVSPSILLPLARKPITESTSLPERTTGRRIPSRSKARVPFTEKTSPLFSPITADEIASTEHGSTNDIADPSKTRAGAAFDRYGPGGWRGADETLQGSVDCKRPGLFRHPKYCNKFYSCNYDPWKKRYTLSVFNCPVHLAYDSNIGACNWPSKGPACADDNLLV